MKEYLLSCRRRLAALVPAFSLLFPVTAFASETGDPSVQTVLDLVTDMVAWCLKTFTSFTQWLIGDSLGGIYLAMFIIGFAIAALFRLLHSA